MSAPERIWIDTIRRNGPWHMVAGADCPRVDSNINAAYLRADLVAAKDARIADMLEGLKIAHDYLAGNGWEGDPRLEPIVNAIEGRS